jgi:hypothetical protein
VIHTLPPSTSSIALTPASFFEGASAAFRGVVNSWYHWSEEDNPMHTTKPHNPISEATLFARILTNGQGEMSSDLARYILTLGFGEEDQARMQDLAQRNQEGALSAEEHEELMHFVGAGHLLALLHAKARKALQHKQAS